MGLLPGVGAPRRAALNHVGALAPYLRYYSSLRPLDDHGTRPAVLVVFDDEIAMTHFLRVAREEIRAERVTVPLWSPTKGPSTPWDRWEAPGARAATGSRLIPSRLR